MKATHRHTAVILLLLLLFCQAVWAAPAAPTALQKVRYSLTQEKVRIVFDVNTLPQYTVTQQENPTQLVFDFANTLNKVALPSMVFNDPVVKGVTLSETGPGQQRAVIDLKTAVMYKVFTLKNPNRIVVDILRSYNQKLEQEIAPGVKYTYLTRGTPDGPITAYILDIAPNSGFVLKPVLSNNMIPGVETVEDMAKRTGALAAINSSYFANDGQILGLLKIDGAIAATGDLPRTAIGIMPDNTFVMDTVDYDGTVTLPGGKTLQVSGVNCERGPDNLIIYNSYFGPSTLTNSFGTEYGIVAGKVVAIGKGNMTISPGMKVLSAHGAMETALNGLKVGDAVQINETLGPVWDKTLHVIGVGPRLVKDGSVFLTTKVEEFGSDVAGGRAPRTAVGITKDGHFLMVVVDGRQSHSIGMTLLELALFMQECGAYDAMNFDGGGSSQMVIKGREVNKPSDGMERRVGGSLILIPDKLVNSQ